MLHCYFRLGDFFIWQQFCLEIQPMATRVAIPPKPVPQEGSAHIPMTQMAIFRLQAYLRQLRALPPQAHLRQHRLYRLP